MNDLLTVNEVADILRVDATTVRRWAKAGALEVVVLPHLNKRQSYRIRRETLNKLLENQLPQSKSHNGHHAHAHVENLEAVAV